MQNSEDQFGLDYFPFKIAEMMKLIKNDRNLPKCSKEQNICFGP